MQPKKTTPQRELFGAHFREMLNPDHPLFVLAERIDWSHFDAAIKERYAAQLSRPGVNTRLMSVAQLSSRMEGVSGLDQLHNMALFLLLPCKCNQRARATRTNSLKVKESKHFGGFGP